MKKGSDPGGTDTASGGTTEAYPCSWEEAVNTDKDFARLGSQSGISATPLRFGSSTSVERL